MKHKSVVEGRGVGYGSFEDILVHETMNSVSNSQKTLHLHYKDQKTSGFSFTVLFGGYRNPSLISVQFNLYAGQSCLKYEKYCSQLSTCFKKKRGV
jgi:hypothetical protein